MNISHKAMTFCAALLLPALSFASAPSNVSVTLAKQTGVSVEQAQLLVDQVFDALRSELKDGRAVTVQNFGRFHVQERAARAGRNPRTGQAIQIPARRYPRFASADTFKKEMNAEEKSEQKSADVALVTSPAQAPAVTTKQ